MSGTPKRVYVVDDDSRLTASLLPLLKQRGYSASTYASAVAFLADYPNLAPGCIILDLVMEGMSGLQLQRELLTIGCNWPVIVLTGHAGRSAAARAVQAGAVAFLIKPVREIELMAALQKGQAQLSAPVITIPAPEAVRRVARLAPRERGVLLGMVRAKFNKEIAAEFGITESTVKSYRNNLMKKLGARTTADLVVLAIRAGLVKL
jgi:two-component system response regulator FixJ